MSQSKSYQFETENFTCEVTIPPEPEKYPVELMFTVMGWNTTVSFKPEELHGLMVFCDKHLKSIGLKKP